MTDYTELIKRLYNSDWNVIDIEEAAAAITQLTRDLADMTADRDSWYQQQSDRVDDAVQFAKERDEARTEVKRLTRERNAVAKDAERLDFLVAQDARVARSRDGDVFHVGRYEDADGDLEWVRLGPTCDTPRAAIDAAISASNQEVAK